MCHGRNKRRTHGTNKNMFISHLFNLLIFLLNKNRHFFDGQEVENNPLNCVLIYIYRNPPDPMGYQEFFFIFHLTKNTPSLARP